MMRRKTVRCMIAFEVWQGCKRPRDQTRYFTSMKISVARITTMRPVWTEDVYHVDRRCSKSRGAKMYVDLTHVFQFEVTKMYPFPVDQKCTPLGRHLFVMRWLPD